MIRRHHPAGSAFSPGQISRPFSSIVSPVYDWGNRGLVGINLVAMMRRECKALLDRARDTKDHAKKGELLRRALELAANAEALERKLKRPSR